MALAHCPVTDFAASACCSCGIVTTVIATTPNNASAAILAIIAIDVLVVLVPCDSLSILVDIMIDCCFYELP